MALPGHTNALIAAVAAANPTGTAVVMQSGTPVDMTPWIDAVPALLHAWYGGNETGNAIADILFGSDGANPSAKLPLSFPRRNEDNPAYLNFRSERGRALYGEDVYVGYRFYEKVGREVLFPFGHGLSYTAFGFDGSVDVSEAGKDDEKATVTVTASVRNTGAVPGRQVVQVYVSPRAPSINRPPKELKGFAKTDVLRPGEAAKVEVELQKKYAAAFWDELRDAWVVEEGVYDVLVGDSSASTPLKGEFTVGKTFWWRGL